MPTVKGVLQKYQEGQNIFRREAVACLVARIEQLEKYIASQQSVQSDLREAQREQAIFLAGGHCAVMFDQEDRASR